MGHIYGYARVSTKSQSLDIQEAELRAAGCERIFSDKATGKNTNRPGFQELLKTLLPGDTIIIAKLDRIGRNVKDLITLVNSLKDQDVGFKVLDNAAIDTTSPAGELIFTVFAAVAQYERDLILERTEKGRQAAKEQGRTGGRKEEIDDSKIKAIQTLVESGMDTLEACKQIGISRASYYRRKN